MSKRQPVKVLLARFPQNNHEHCDVTDWLLQTVLELQADERVANFDWWKIADTPITMGRNRAVEVARQNGFDLVLMVDNDMKPDMYEGGLPFWKSSFDYWWEHNHPAVGEPCIIAAPYCGPPPNELPYVFRWRSLGETDVQQPSFKLDMYTREEAYLAHGITEVAALPTGLILFDIRAFDKLTHPYFYYEYGDEKQIVKVSTEDVTCTRDLNLRGVKLYCNWESWAGHWKSKLVGKPLPLAPNAVPLHFRRQVLADIQAAQ